MLRTAIPLLLLSASVAAGQVGPGEFDPAVGGDPSIGEDSEAFPNNPDAGDAPSIGEASDSFANTPSAGDAPSVGDANAPFDPPGEGAPLGRLDPVD